MRVVGVVCVVFLTIFWFVNPDCRMITYFSNNLSGNSFVFYLSGRC